MAENRKEQGAIRYYFSRGQLVLLGSGFTLTSVVIFLAGIFIGQKIEENKLLNRSDAPLVKIPTQTLPSGTAQGAPAGEEPTFYDALAKGAAKSNPAKKGTDVPQAEAKTEDKTKAKKLATKTEAAPATEKTEGKAESASQGEWTVQVNAFPHERDARNLAKNLGDKGYDAYVVPVESKGKAWYRVRVGHFPTREQAKELQDTMVKKENFSTAIAVSR
jgi:DedD protein